MDPGGGGRFQRGGGGGGKLLGWFHSVFLVMESCLCFHALKQQSRSPSILASDPKCAQAVSLLLLLLLKPLSEFLRRIGWVLAAPRWLYFDLFILFLQRSAVLEALYSSDEGWAQELTNRGVACSRVSNNNNSYDCVFQFLVASKRLYKTLCPSVGRLVRRSVGVIYIILDHKFRCFEACRDS